jgi:hypothetical protein
MTACLIQDQLMQVSSLQQQGTGQRMHKETSGSYIYEFYEGDIPHSHQGAARIKIINYGLSRAGKCHGDVV